ncbi:hypothetical protein JKP88DRAFT_247838 [Tribonema minus]|uniref:Uncharacterized protein n=1 Tax=Tribonema minus TaxID=303371 RepID=A0A836CAT5_9STRA|nr:hypothetical protein JKP88DRAFT_247838 [Tribonema minus]
MKVAACLLFGGAALVDGFLTGPATITALAPGQLPMTRTSTSSSVRSSGGRGEDKSVHDRLRTIENSVSELLSEFAVFKSKLDTINEKVSIVPSWSNTDTLVGVFLGAATTIIVMSIMDGPK